MGSEHLQGQGRAGERQGDHRVRGEDPGPAALNFRGTSNSGCVSRGTRATDSACASTSGSWYSPYDGATWTAASDVDIDHVVPLAEAWRSGASSWTDARRQSFANDLSRPQLIAVTDNVNSSKGDQDPSTWQPSRTAYRCTYAKIWIAVKNYYSLTLQSAEKTALQSALTTYC